MKGMNLTKEAFRLKKDKHPMKNLDSNVISVSQNGFDLKMKDNEIPVEH